ncbi:beta-galactosidase [Candidatus Sumerlaeota bacterium]
MTLVSLVDVPATAGGKPVLLVNGRQQSLILAATYRPGARDFNTFREAGIEVFSIYSRLAWTGPGEWDFSGTDEKLDEYLALDRQALFLPRILLTPGSWFGELYPDEITMRDDGTPAGMFRHGPHPSFASATYRELSHELMSEFITHLEQSYGDNIVGYQVGNGFGGEWLPFNSFWEVRGDRPHPTKFGVEDYSPASIAAFRAWLSKKYDGDVAALRGAWGDEQVTFATAAAPGEVARYTTSKGIFFDPAVSSQAPDFLLYFNDSVADLLLANAAWIKEITGRRKIVGSFYGALWMNFPNLSANHTGQLALTRVLNSADIDFVCSPYTYDNKQLGGPHNAQSLPEAANLHGKLYFSETDTETHLHARQWRWGDSLHNPENWPETKALLVRDFGYAFTKGIGMWWTDLAGGTFDDPQIVQLLRQLKEIDEAELTTDKSSTAEIAVILDEASFTYCGDGEPMFNALLTAQKQWEFGFMGLPWEPHLLSDMDNPALKEFKVYVFLNTIKVSPRQREAIHARLRRNGATAVWVYATGYIDEACEVENSSRLTGIGLAEEPSAGELRVELTNHDHPLTRQLPEGLAYGTDERVEEIIRHYDHRIYLKDPRDPGLHRDLPGFRISPRFYADDSEATVLGMLRAGIDKPGLVVKPQDGWTSIYSGAPILPSSLLRAIARTAGVHIYSDADDVVVANSGFLCLYSPQGGTRTVRLPEPATVTDMLTGQTIAEHATEFPLALAAHTTVLLRLAL